MKRLMCVVLIMLFVSGMLFAGGQSENEGSEGYELAVILMEVENTFYQYVMQGMQKAADETGNKLIVGNAESSVINEKHLVDTYIAQKADVIMLSAFDSEASIPAIEAAKKAGVPIINWNTTNPAMQYFVGADNYNLGYLAGEFMVENVNKEMGGKGTVGIVTADMFEVVQWRVDGFLDAIKKQPGIKVVGRQDGRTPEEAQQKTEAMIQAFPELDLMFATTGAATMGILSSLRATGKEADVKVYGTDLDEVLANQLLSDKSPVMSISAQSAIDMGYTTYMTGLKIISGDNVDMKTYVPVEIYKKGESERINEWLKNN
jgi:ABC-type sugar transport system substrate-binding protein